MTTKEYTFQLSEKVARDAEMFGLLTSEQVEALLRAEMERKMSAMAADPDVQREIAAIEAESSFGGALTGLSDTEVLARANSQMEMKQNQRLSELLDKQQSGNLTEDSERSELEMLMQVYEFGLLRKAQALHEAVKRGLQKPLEP